MCWQKAHHNVEHISFSRWKACSSPISAGVKEADRKVKQDGRLLDFNVFFSCFLKIFSFNTNFQTYCRDSEEKLFIPALRASTHHPTEIIRYGILSSLGSFLPPLLQLCWRVGFHYQKQKSKNMCSISEHSAEAVLKWGRKKSVCSSHSPLNPLSPSALLPAAIHPHPPPRGLNPMPVD